MSDSHAPPESKDHHGSATINLLESVDGMAHYLVAALLLLLAVTILAVSTCQFVADVTAAHPKASFTQNALFFLSDILFGVIVLELLSTILTYIRAHKLESTIKDFLIVGLISCVRKILLTGAQSSLEPPKMPDFVQESIGTIILIVGICLLIGALLFLDKRKNAARDEEFEH